jgi:hypothetical protein
MRYLLVFALLLLGCSHTPIYDACKPHAKAKPYEAEYCGIPPPYLRLGTYIKTFEEMWGLEADFPQNTKAINEAFNKITLFWQPYIFRAEDSDRRLLGLTFPEKNNKILVLVYIPPDCRDAACTSLGHELMHIAYGATTGNMRADHLTDGARWPASHIKFLDRVTAVYSER